MYFTLKLLISFILSNLIILNLLSFFYLNKRYKIDLNKKLTSENIFNNQTLMQIATQNDNKDIIYYQNQKKYFQHNFVISINFKK